jgi:antitoxin ParD1/3/4
MPPVDIFLTGIDDAAMDKNTLSVVMPDPLRTFVDERVLRGDFADAGEYLRDLVRRDREAQAASRLRELIEVGLASGQPRVMSESDWTKLRDVALGRGA